MNLKLWSIVKILVLWVVLSGLSLAYGQEVFNEILTTFQDSGEAFGSRIITFAERLFFLLLTISFIWNVYQWVFKSAGGEVSLFAGLFKFILIAGILLWLLRNGGTFVNSILESFGQLGALVTGGSIPTPSGIINRGAELNMAIAEKSNIWDVGAQIAGLIMYLAFVVLAIQLLIAEISAAILVSLSALFIAFSGLELTREYALNVFKSAITIGAQLLLIMFIVATAAQFTDRVVDVINGRDKIDGSVNLFALGVAVILAYLAIKIPQLVSNLMSGGSGGMSGAGVAGTALVGLGAAVAGLNMAANAMGGAAKTLTGAARALGGGGGGGGGSISPSEALAQQAPPTGGGGGGGEASGRRIAAPIQQAANDSGGSRSTAGGASNAGGANEPSAGEGGSQSGASNQPGAGHGRAIDAAIPANNTATDTPVADTSTGAGNQAGQNSAGASKAQANSGPLAEGSRIAAPLAGSSSTASNSGSTGNNAAAGGGGAGGGGAGDAAIPVNTTATDTPVFDATTEGQAVAAPVQSGGGVNEPRLGNDADEKQGDINEEDMRVDVDSNQHRGKIDDGKPFRAPAPKYEGKKKPSVVRRAGSLLSSADEEGED